MGWLGTLFVGAVIGIVGHALQGRWREPRYWAGVGIAAVSALVVKMLGNITGVLVDGASLEWLAAVVAAIASVALFDAFAMRAPAGSAGSAARAGLRQTGNGKNKGNTDE